MNQNNVESGINIESLNNLLLLLFTNYSQPVSNWEIHGIINHQQITTKMIF